MKNNHLVLQLDWDKEQKYRLLLEIKVSARDRNVTFQQGTERSFYKF